MEQAVEPLLRRDAGRYRRLLRFAPWLLLVVAILLGVWAGAEGAAARARTVVTIAIKPADWKPVSGHAWYATVPAAAHDADDAQDIYRSRWVLLENGQPFGTAHASHQDIIDKGGGRYSNWATGFYLSTPDNTDPTVNGRIYSARKSLPLDLRLTHALRIAAGVFGVAAAAGLGWLALIGLGRMAPRVARMTSLVRKSKMLVSALRATPGILLAAMNAVLALVIIASLAGVERRVTLHAEFAEPAGGFGYFIPFPELKGSSDGNDAPRRSQLRVFEDGVELGPAHAMHSDIIGKGQGRFSHWYATVGVSARDNSDVRRNGHVYSALYRAAPPAAAIVGVLTLWLAAFGIALRQRAGLLRAAKPTDALALLRDTGAPLLAVAALGAWAASLVIYGSSNADLAFDAADAARKMEQGVVALALAVAGAGALAWRDWRTPLTAIARVAGGALIVLMCVYGVLDLNYGLSNQSPVLLLVFLAALAAALGVRLFMPAWRDMAVRRIGSIVPAERGHVWIAIGVCCALTVIQVAPEVIRYWDQSGWMDSDDYDRIAHNISTGLTPAGDSLYPPVYQYGLAGLYWAFGHFFFVQQLANVALALATTAFLCAAAWLLFRDLFAVWLAGLFAAHWESLHHATWYTQIEGWYVPIFVASLAALAWYLRRPGMASIILLGLAAGVVLATRQQGILYAGGLGAAVLAAAGIRLRERLSHIVVFGAVLVAVGILPWSARNYAVEHRFSPSSTQSVEFLAELNDPRIPLYGIRYWEGIGAVSSDWIARYPDVAQRHDAMQAYFVQRLTRDPGYFIAAAPWRAAAFYGLIPNEVIYNVWSLDKFWANPLPHLLYIFRFWAPLLASLIGLGFAITSRRAWLLAALIPANVAVGLLVGSAEPRLCYPVLALNMLLALAVIAPFAPQPAPVASRSRHLRWTPLVGAAAVIAFAAHVTVGQANLHRPIKSASYIFRPDVAIDASLPAASLVAGGMGVDGAVVKALEPGKRYRAQLYLTNSQFPARYGSPLAGMDDSLHRDGSVSYFLTSALTTGGVVLRFDAVTTPQPLREGMTIEGEIVVDKVSDVFPGSPTYNWARLDKAVVQKVER